jgi:hypothetical protein
MLNGAGEVGQGRRDGREQAARLYRTAALATLTQTGTISRSPLGHQENGLQQFITIYFEVMEPGNHV